MLRSAAHIYFVVGALGIGVAATALAGPGPPDNTAPTVNATARSPQQVQGPESIQVAVSSSEDGVVRLTGRLQMRSGSLRLLGLLRHLQADRRREFPLRLRRPIRRRVMRALRAGQRVRARVVVSVRDSQQNRVTRKLVIELTE